MIRRIQALNYRCLRYADVQLGRFCVLVGPNASGKSTLCDAIAFLSDLVSYGLDAAVERRTHNFQDLIWGRQNPSEQSRQEGRAGDAAGFELAVEFDIPAGLQEKLPNDKAYKVFRYEVAITETDGEVRIDSERGMLGPEQLVTGIPSRDRFPDRLSARQTILAGARRTGWRTILSKSSRAKDNFNIETSSQAGKGWATSIAFGPHRSTLGNLPESPDKFPVATHVKRVFERGVQNIFLNSAKMRAASPPGRSNSGFLEDGSNLPWVIKRLQKEHRDRYRNWLRHVQVTLGDLTSIRVVERPEDRHAYLKLQYRTGVEVPSWMASDGTLRLLALTLLAWLPDVADIYLLEEPENGIHPVALEPVYQSLSSVYESQVLVATHSPLFLRLAEPQQVLCFARNQEGATDIVGGDKHPYLREQSQPSELDILLCTEVLGEGQQ